MESRNYLCQIITVLAVLVVLLTFVSNGRAAAWYWEGWGDSNSWCDPCNWGELMAGTVPYYEYDGYPNDIEVKAACGRGRCVILDPDPYHGGPCQAEGPWCKLRIGPLYMDDLNGGDDVSLSLQGALRLSKKAESPTAIFDLRAGLVTCEKLQFGRENNSNGILNMSGGTITVRDRLSIPYGLDLSHTHNHQLNLVGGEIHTHTFELNRRCEGGIVDINNGILTMDEVTRDKFRHGIDEPNDVSGQEAIAVLQAHADAGEILAYGKKHGMVAGGVQHILLFDDGVTTPGKITAQAALISPTKAYDPYPADEATGVALDPNNKVVLSWGERTGATLHDVYFSDNESDVNNGTGGTFKGKQRGRTYYTEALGLGDTRYWRIDEHVPIWPGTDLINDDFESDSGKWATPTGDWVQMTTRDANSGSYSSGLDGNNDAGTMTSIELDTSDACGVRVSFAYKTNSGTVDLLFYNGSGYDLIADDLSNDNWKNYSVLTDDPCYLRANFKIQFSGTTGGGPRYALVDDVVVEKATSKNVYKGDVWQFTIDEEGKARSPYPDDGVVDVETPTVTLEWEPGIAAVKHNVYFSTTFSDVNEGTDPNSGAGQGRQDANDFTASVSMNTVYYWRIDEVGATEPNNPRTGDVWSFTVNKSGADFNGDRVVNFLDYAVLARAWLTTPANGDYNDICDLVDDNSIDYNDLALFTDDWPWIGNIAICPIEYPNALRNPLKGFRPWENQTLSHPFGTLARWYIGWSEIENDESDDVNKIQQYCDNIWADYPQHNVKVIPRIFLDYPSWGTYWPADMNTGDYSSQQFRDRLTRLIGRLGQCWDNDPRVAYIEMGFIGKWGEHHSPDVSPEMQTLMGNAFTSAFQNKLIMHRHPWDFTSYQFGIHWDSFAHGCQENHATGIEALGDRWHNAVIGGEVAYNWGDACLYVGCNPTETVSTPAYYNRVINYIRRLHTNHLGWVSSYDYNNSSTDVGADKMQKAFGYRFVIDEVRYPAEVVRNQLFNVSFVVRNTGSSSFYYNWPVELSLLSTSTKAVVWQDTFSNVNIRNWLPGDNWNEGSQQYNIQPSAYTAQGTFTVPGSVPVGEYELALAILDPAGNLPSVRFAIENYYTGGRHPIGLVGVETTVTNPQLNPATFDDPQNDSTLHYVVE